MFSSFLTPVLTQISFESFRLLYSHASAEVRGENTPERNFTSTESQTHNHQVMSPACSPLSHLGRAIGLWEKTAACHNFHCILSFFLSFYFQYCSTQKKIMNFFLYQTMKNWNSKRNLKCWMKERNGSRYMCCIFRGWPFASCCRLFLTFYNTNLTCNDTEVETFLKTLLEMEKSLETVFSTLSKITFLSLAKLNLWTANGLFFVNCELFLCGKGCTLYHTTKF